MIGFPALAEHHLTVGIGYNFRPNLAVNLEYTHAFKNNLSESGTAPFGQPVKIKSEFPADV